MTKGVQKQFRRLVEEGVKHKSRFSVVNSLKCTTPSSDFETSQLSHKLLMKKAFYLTTSPTFIAISSQVILSLPS